MPGSLSSVGEETGGLLPLCCPSLPWGPNQFAGLLQIFRNPRGHLLHYLRVVVMLRRGTLSSRPKSSLFLWARLFSESRLLRYSVKAPPSSLLSLWLHVLLGSPACSPVFR